jgi:hypothetical protein
MNHTATHTTPPNPTHFPPCASYFLGVARAFDMTSPIICSANVFTAAGDQGVSKEAQRSAPPPPAPTHKLTLLVLPLVLSGGRGRLQGAAPNDLSIDGLPRRHLGVLDLGVLKALPRDGLAAGALGLSGHVSVCVCLTSSTQLGFLSLSYLYGNGSRCSTDPRALSRLSLCVSAQCLLSLSR